MDQFIKKLPLTPLQSVMLMEGLKNPSSMVYWQAVSYELLKYYEIDEIKNAWLKVIEANPALRTRIDWDNISEPMQVIDSSFEVDITLIHYENLVNNDGSIENWINKELRTLQQYSFNVLQRIYIVEGWKDGKQLLVWLHHHILVDGWSMSQILEDFFNILGNISNTLNERPDVELYLDFIQKREYKQKCYKYWLNELNGAESAERLSFEGSITGSKIEKFEIYDRTLSTKANRNIHLYSAQNRITVSSIAMALWGLILNRYQITNRLFLGSTFALRPYQLNESYDMNGMLINTLPVKINLQNDISIKDLCFNTMDSIQDVAEHSGIAYSKLLQLSELPGDTELFKSSVIFQNYRGGLNFEGAKLVHQNGTSSDPLSLTINLSPDNAELRLGWDSNRYQKQDLLTLIDALEYMFEEIEFYESKSIKEFNLTSLEKEKIKNNLENELSIKYDFFSIDTMVDWRSNEVALSDGKVDLSYIEVRNSIELIANYLIQVGVRSGDTVALYGEKGIEVAIGIFASWRIGANWCTLDKCLPETRNKHILKLIKPKYTLNLEEIREILSDDLCKNKLLWNAYNFQTDDLAYFISTSGSTGKPKLVSIGIEGIFQIIESWKKFYQFNEKQNILQLGSWVSDVYLGDLLKAWSTGGSLIVCEENKRMDMKYLHSLSENYEISFVESTPHFIREFLKYLYNENLKVKNLKTIVVGSDVFRLEEKNEIYNMLWDGVRLYNGYGLSECTIESVVYRCKDLEQISDSGMCLIGQPLPGTFLRIVDEAKKPVAPGMIGELHIGGNQVMKCYIDEEGMDTSKIYEYNNRRYFMTGDKVRINSNGMLEYFGRQDQQVKIRGYRLELGEIENSFLSLNKGMECFLTYSLIEGERELVVFLSGIKDSEDEIRKKISKKLPFYAIPRFVVILDELPRNSNGKIDRPLLIKEAKRIINQKNYIAPITSNEIEDIVKNTWEMALGRKVHVNKTFFDQGGHSLIILKLFNQLQKNLSDYNFEIGDLFRFPTIEKFVEQISLRKNQKKSINQIAEPVNKMELLEQIKQGKLSVDEAMYSLGGNEI